MHTWFFGEIPFTVLSRHRPLPVRRCRVGILRPPIQLSRCDARFRAPADFWWDEKAPPSPPAGEGQQGRRSVRPGCQQPPARQLAALRPSGPISGAKEPGRHSGESPATSPCRPPARRHHLNAISHVGPRWIKGEMEMEMERENVRRRE